MSLTGLVGYCWAGAPPHSTMEMSPSATANSLCMPSSSNDVAAKVYPNCRGKLVLVCPGASPGVNQRRAAVSSSGRRFSLRHQGSYRSLRFSHRFHFNAAIVVGVLRAGRDEVRGNGDECSVANGTLDRRTDGLDEHGERFAVKTLDAHAHDRRLSLCG